MLLVVLLLDAFEGEEIAVVIVVWFLVWFIVRRAADQPDGTGGGVPDVRHDKDDDDRDDALETTMVKRL